MADRVEGDRVFCHQCGNVWMRAEHGLECPECSSDFVEILEDNAEDEEDLHEPSPRATPFPFGIHDGYTPAGVTHHTFRSGDGRFTFTSATYRSPSRSPFGGEQDRGVPFPDPVMPILQNFNNILQGLNHPPGQGPPPGPNFPGYPLDRQRDASDPGEDGGARPGWTTAGRLRPRDANRPQGDAHPFEYVDDILNMFEHELHRGRQVGGGGGGGHAEGGAGIHIAEMGPLGIIAHMLSGGRHGDAVYSQEELDRVISELIDHNMNSGNAPGPASEEAIAQLPKKKIDIDMMGSDGKAECSICMDSVELGTEVTVLPCTHWFHEACITAWLREHDTCPHCRRSIQPPEQRSQSQPPTPSSPSHTRNPPVGSRSNPFVLSDSPPRTRGAPDEFGDLGSEPQRRRTSSGQGSTSFSEWVRQRFGGSGSGSGGESGGGSGSGAL